LAEAKEELRNMLVGQNLVQPAQSSNWRIFGYRWVVCTTDGKAIKFYQQPRITSA
jgi:hypothetical protein